MIKSHIFNEVGMFCNDYFMYSEDVDLCYRVHYAGYKCYYIGAAEVIHHGGGCSKKEKEDNFGTVMMRESRFKFFLNTKGHSYARLYKLSTPMGADFWILNIFVFSLPGLLGSVAWYVQL